MPFDPNKPYQADDTPPSYDTKLSPDEESQFKVWKQKYAPNDAGSDYDLRGAFKAGLKPDPERGHFPDTFKKPNHPTFSDESEYSKGDTVGGKWSTKDGKDVFIPSPWNLKETPPEKLNDYFKRVEPGAILEIPKASATVSSFDPDKPYEAAPTKYADKMADQKKSFSPPEDPVNHPKIDSLSSIPGVLLGDTGRAFSGAVEGIKEGAAKAFPSAQEEVDQDKANRDKYGAVGGVLKGALVDPVSRLGSAATIPLNVLASVASPATGLLHGVGGSALSYLPGMNKETGDQMIDQGMMGLGPEDKVVSAQRSAAAAHATQTQNAAAVAAQPAFAEARRAGYSVHPAETANPGMVSNALAQAGGKIKTEQAASVKNQAVTNKIAARELGLPPDTSLDENTFGAVRKAAGTAYQAMEHSMTKLPRGAVIADDRYKADVAALDNMGHEMRRDFPELAKNPDIYALQSSLNKFEFSPKAGVEAIKRLRFQAKTNLKSFDDPAKFELGKAQRQAADAMEELIDRRLVEVGEANTVNAYRAARQLIAKSYDVEAATDAKGNVDARVLARLSDKRPFTGGLKTIADTASSFPKSMQNPTKFGGLEKRSVLDTFGALASGAGAMAANDWRVALPGLLALVARPAARTAALSERIQNRLLGLKSPNPAGPIVRQAGVPAVAAPNALRALQQGRPGVMPQPAPGPMPPQQPQQVP